MTENKKITELPNIKGAMLLEDTDDYIRWRIPCFCDDSRHDWTIELEHSKKFNDVILFVYANVYTRTPPFHGNIWVDKVKDWVYRIKIAAKVLFLGEVEYDCDIGFKGEGQVRDFANILLTSLEKIKETGKKYGEPDEDVFRDD